MQGLRLSEKPTVKIFAWLVAVIPMQKDRYITPIKWDIRQAVHLLAVLSLLLQERSISRLKAAAAALKSLGATVDEVSIPIHLVGPALGEPIGVEGSTQNMMLNAGYGVGRNDLYVTSLMDFLRNWQNRANELAETVKLTIMFGTYIRKYYGSRYYGKAINLCRLLRAAYDKVLNEYDLLAMPTTIKAQPMPAPYASREEYVKGCVPF